MKMLYMDTVCYIAGREDDLEWLGPDHVLYGSDGAGRSLRSTARIKLVQD